MENMMIQYLPTFFIGLPVIVTVSLYYVGVRISGSKWKVIHKTVQWSAIFYIIAVSILLSMILQRAVFGYVLIFLIIVLAATLIIQWRKKTEVILMDGLRLLWRISFLLFFLTYIGLLSYLIIRFILLRNGY